MINQRTRELLRENDRGGERAIALVQTLVALMIIVLHLLSAMQNGWSTFNVYTALIVGAIIVASLARVRLGDEIYRNEWRLHVLTVIDGLLIFSLILSYSWAYDLPLDAVFRSPSLVFLVVYCCIRILRFDHVPILISGGTILTCWFSLILVVLALDDTIPSENYKDFVTGTGILVGSVIEMALGFAALVAILATAGYYARTFIANSAHIEDLEAANRIAGDNIERHRAILNSSVDAIVIVDSNGVIERANRSLQQLFGYTSDELIGSSVAMLMSPQNAHLLRQGIERFMKTGQSRLVGQSFTSKGVHRDGHSFPIELSISDFLSSGKRSFAGFIRDISERERVEARQRQIQEQFEIAVQTALDAIIIIDQEGLIVSFNPAAEDIFGFKAADVVGKNMGDTIVPERYRSAHTAGMERYLATGDGPVLNTRIEIQGLHSSGREFEIELAIKVIEGGDGKLFIGYARDITDRKTAEAELVEAKVNAEVANRAKASFLAMMSHEIRTPLNGVLGILSLLQDADLNDRQRNLLQTARRSGRTLLGIINDILDYSKLEAGKLEIEESSYVLDQVFDSVTNLIRPAAAEKGLQISAEIDPRLPDVLHGDPDRLRQIVLNLGWNAVKFTETGSIRLVASRETGSPEDQLKISVSDTGVGIPAEKHGDLFAEFSTIDAGYARKFGGSGLGLAISKALVTAMNGEIGVRSEVGVGSEFWISIPLAEGDPRTVQEDAADFGEVEGKQLNLRVLVAEDNVTNQLVVSNMLERFGCTVDIANNGLEAVQAVQERPYDVVLMDVSMPEMDGMAATVEIRKLAGPAADVPILALTAHALDEDRERAFKAGMNAFVPKPVQSSELFRSLAEVVPGASGAGEPDGPTFDEMSISAVLDSMDETLRERLQTQFHEDVARKTAEITTAIAANDAVVLDQASHALKGAAGTVGASALAALAAEINQLAKQNALGEAKPLADRLVELSETTLEEFDEIIRAQK